MFRPRIIPVLLLKDNVLVNSIRFKNHRYIGDPINAVRIFNNFKADELIFLDINAAQKNKKSTRNLIKQVGEEANMPFAIGGGIGSIQDIRQAIAAGAEKVVIGSAALNKDFIKTASDTFGSSTIAVCMDVRKNFFGQQRVWIKNGKRSTGYKPESFAQLMQTYGAGELILQSIEKDGMMEGYDLDLIRRVSLLTTLPVVALGGAGKTKHLQQAVEKGKANAVAAASLFLYQGTKKGVLLNYPATKNIFTNTPTG